MDLKEFKEFYSANKDNDELKSFMNEEFKHYASSEDGVKFLQPVFDSHSSKVVEAFKQKGMEKEFQKRLEAEKEKIKLELNPPVNPLEQRIAELEARNNKIENEKIILDVKTRAMKSLKYPELENLINVTTDEEATLSSINNVNDVIDKIIDSKVEDKLKSSARVPGGSSNSMPQGFFTQDQVANMDSNEIKKNFDKIQESQKHW